jgi:hypothetical protein
LGGIFEKNEKGWINTNKVKSMKRIRSGLGLLTFLYLTCCLWTKTGMAAGVESFHWGLTVEELNQALSKGESVDFILREDTSRPDIELPYTPLKKLKIPRGRLTALDQVKKSAGPDSLGQLFGYGYEGRFFGRVELFKQTPWTSLPEITRALKEKFPEGKVIRSFSGPKTFSYFEYRGTDLYVFTNEQGVYYFEPLSLNKVIRDEQKIAGDKDSKELEEMREKLKGP